MGPAAFASLLLATPFVVAGNLLANRGPLMYRQERVGRRGRVFTLLKFRSMRQDAEKDGKPVEST